MNKFFYLQPFIARFLSIFNQKIKFIFVFIFVFANFYIFSPIVNAARTNCTNIRVISTGSCSNCRVSRRMCGTCDITSTVFGVTTTKRSNICWTDFVACCTNVCAGPCPTCSYGSSGTYVCGDCSCAKTCNRCCSAPTCNSGEKTTSSPYGSSCNATTVSRNNGCGYAITCYTYKTPTAGTCNTGDVTSAASCPLGVVSSYTTTNATCGGSNRTCYKCQTCTAPVAGTCNAGDFTTLAAVLGNGSCQYPYTTYTTTNASCGGTNITCYKRGISPLFANGTCQPGERTTACPPTETLINSYTTSNAQCGGTNITCYKCGNAFCSIANTYADGSPDCRYCLSKDDIQCQDFPPSIPDLDPENVCTTPPNQLLADKCVVLIQADGSKSLSCPSLSATNPYIFLRGNDGSDGSQNYRPIACSEYNSNYVAANKCEKNQLPVPIPNFCDGQAYVNGVTDQCVYCLPFAAPWFQVIGGNIYAKDTISSEVSSDLSLMRNHDYDCATSEATFADVGIPVAGNKIINVTSQNTDEVGASFSNGFASIDPENYDFFARSLGYSSSELVDEVKICSDLNSNDPALFTLKDSFICTLKSTNTTPFKLSNFLTDPSVTATLTVPAGMRKVIFVDGDIELDREIILEKSADPAIANGFLLLLASGDIIISPYLGEFITDSNLSLIGGNCALQTPSLHGIFIANGTINFASGGDNNAFTNTTVNRNCDKKITVKGSFIGWGKNESNQSGISMNRTFAGCVQGDFADASVPTYVGYDTNYNATTPVITFIYDVDLINNFPLWVQKTVWMRFEVR